MKVLVPLDESELALSIIPAVRRVLAPCLEADARLAGLLAVLPGTEVPAQPMPSAQVHLLTVLHPRQAPPETAKAAPEPTDRQDSRHEALAGLGHTHLSPETREQAAQEAATRLLGIAQEHFSDANTACHILWSEMPAERIVQFADELDVDAIVMATHGRSGVARLLAGSVAEAVIRTSRCPVVVQRPPMSHGHIVQETARAMRG